MKAGKIFINYRRDDSRADAGRLYDRLNGRYPGRIFRDVGSLEPGIEWRDAIDKVLSGSDACIVVIGRTWLTMTDASGRRRLDDPRDTVRQEVETALKAGIRVFPILVGGAHMPAEDELPAGLQALARRNALEITEQDWDEDFDKLVTAVEKVLGWSPPKPVVRGSRSRTVLYVAAGVVTTVIGLAIVGAVIENKPADKPVNPPHATDVVKNAPEKTVNPAEVNPPIAKVVKPDGTQPAPEGPAPHDDRPRRPVRDPKTAALPDPPRVPVTAPVVATPPPAAPRRPTAVDYAQEALSAGRLIAPRSDSALHWALQAQQNGDPGAINVMQQTNDAILIHIKTLNREKRVEEEVAFLNAYAEYYPVNSPMQRTIQQIRDQVHPPQRALRLQVIHRHGIDYRTARCEGWLEIDPAGTVSYACDPQFVHDARCDRVTFPPGAFTYKAGGEQLRIASSSGNFDFFAPQSTIEQAVSALSAAGARIQPK
jgi:hypothetical protein